MRHLNVSLFVRAKSQDSVHKPQLLKESRSGPNRGLSVYRPSALPLGHNGLTAAGAQRKGKETWGFTSNETIKAY